jgi:hypothetical protein
VWTSSERRRTGVYNREDTFFFFPTRTKSSFQVHCKNTYSRTDHYEKKKKLLFWKTDFFFFQKSQLGRRSVDFSLFFFFRTVRVRKTTAG